MANNALSSLYLADPFVLRTSEGYFAYGTDGPERYAFEKSNREFPILRSQNLQDWEFVGGALKIPKPLTNEHFWAPEVAEKNGTYFMYYSAGGIEGRNQKLRVAIASDPRGPFIGEDKPLVPNEPFTIDAHPFQDPITNNWYLFFAKDSFNDPTGTGIAVAKLGDDMRTIDGPIASLLRGGAEWQIFERDRFWYDRTWPIWFCVEGPFVVYRNNRYWMFYSGGNWHASDYGVGCAVAENVTGPYQDMYDGPGVVTTGSGLYGPGHCSIVVGPDNNDYICFHAWDENYTARRFHIAPLEWTTRGPKAKV